MCAFWRSSGASGTPLPAVGGYVLAGGRSSRMGSSKALLELGGMRLIEHATRKAGRLCDQVSILTSDPALLGFGRAVPDVHADCGPLGGIEAALLDSEHDWNLILPIDCPFLPAWYLADWMWAVLHGRPGPARMAILAEGDVRHPALLLIHRDARPYLTAALERRDFRLLPALRKAALALGERARARPEEVLLEWQWDFWTAGPPGERPPWAVRTERQADESLWFVNLNTPADFAAAQNRVDALDR